MHVKEHPEMPGGVKSPKRSGVLKAKVVISSSTPEWAALNTPPPRRQVEILGKRQLFFQMNN